MSGMCFSEDDDNGNLDELQRFESPATDPQLKSETSYEYVYLEHIPSSQNESRRGTLQKSQVTNDLALKVNTEGCPVARIRRASSYGGSSHASSSFYLESLTTSVVELDWRESLQKGNYFMKHHLWGKNKLRMVWMDADSTKIFWGAPEKSPAQSKGFIKVNCIIQIIDGIQPKTKNY
jgi:hypothetical protein